ncbi:AI-2E family transporter [Pedobacter sp.]|nr:AI-2E family transporter [Candidatus Saccharibacteria bacterium]
MKVKIDIDTNTFIRFGLVILGFVAAILIILKTQSALTTIGISVFLALALNPPVSMISHRLPGKSRVGATAISYLLVISILAGLLFLVVPPVVQQSSKFAQTVPQLIDQAATQQRVAESFIERYGLSDQVDKAVANAKDQASTIAASLGTTLVDSAGAFFGGAATLLFILVLTFLMLIEGPMWMKQIWGLYTDSVKLERHKRVVHKMYRVVTGYVNGQMLVALISSTCTLVTILILSALFPLPANLAVPLAAIIFLTGLIPMIGATLGAILVALVLALNSVAAAIIFVIYFIVYQQIENNLISPTIQSKTVELSALMVLSAVLIGISLFGILGGIISIPIAGCIRVLTVNYLEHTRELREAKKTKNPVAKLINKAKSA